MEKERYLYSELANCVQARLNCIEKGNHEWAARHFDAIKQLADDFLPSGSGFDGGTSIDLNKSHADKLVFDTSFHHMTEAGYYDGWTEHTITVTPAFIGGFHIRVSGRNRNDIKPVIEDVFSHDLTKKIEQTESGQYVRAGV